ncbi:MAG: beta-galactosidase [Mycobacterium sp.]|nr:beta-galactosidase [Mycobacterium sp.]
MSAAAYVGRVGGLAIALGVGVAVVTGYGGGQAWAETPSPGSTSGTSSTSSSTSDGAGSPGDDSASQSDASADSADGGDADTTETPDEAGVGDEAGTDPTQSGDESESGDGSEVEADADEAEIPTATAEPEPIATEESRGSSFEPPATNDDVDNADVPINTVDSEPEDLDRVNSFATRTMSSTADEDNAQVTTAVTPPAVPSLRLWPTGFDPGTAVTYVTGIVSSLVNAALSPFASGLPSLPADPPTLWTLLAWVRREFFNGSPTIAYNPVQNTQSLVDGDVLIKGNVGAADPDDDQLTYTVIGRPLNGGVVTIDDDGNFTYRPMNAMAAVGGADSFVVVVSDEAAGLHINGPQGLLQFAPIVGNFLNPGGGHLVAKTITVNVTEVDGIDLSLPDDLHRGVALAGFQAEGGPGSPVDPNSDWYKWVHDPINQLLGITNGEPEDGPGTYVKYAEDAALARDELGMNTFRMSIEWSRIFPNSTAAVDVSDEGGGVSQADLEALDALADPEEVAHYKAVFDALRAPGVDLEPLVTINHFTLPAWVHDPTTTRLLAQLGLPAPTAGWLSSDTPVEFEKYAAYVAWKYGGQVDNWTVLNEPVPPVLTEFLAVPGLVPGWPPGLIRPDLASTFLVNQAKGYVAAYDEVHKWDTTVATEGQPAAFVGFANNMVPARPANPVNPLDVQAADAWDSFFNRWFPNAVIDGWVDANLDGIQTPDEIHPEFMNKVDFMGVQYYGSQPMQGFGLAPIPGFPWLKGLPVRCAATSQTCSDFNQPIDPGGFREVLETAASYGVPLWVTENGIADANDSKRPAYIVNHIGVVQDMVAHDSVDIRGYTYWSFVDNLEWSEGYDLKFGLYGSDPTTPELDRIPKADSIAAISAITKSPTHTLPLSVLAQYIPKV